VPAERLRLIGPSAPLGDWCHRRYTLPNDVPAFGRAPPGDPVRPAVTLSPNGA